MKSDNSFLSPGRKKLKEIRDMVLQKTAEDGNVKTNVPQNITLTFLLFKASAFL